MAYIGKEPGSGLRGRFIYTATAGQTSFTGADSLGRTLTYTDGEYTDVFLNGVKLDKTDYTATSGTSIVLDSGASADDTLEILAFDTFGLFSGEFAQDITVSGKVTGDLTIEDDLKLTSDNAQIAFGADSDVTLTHDPDKGLLLKNTNTADGSFAKLTFQTGETAIETNDPIGRIDFQAPDEATGTDAVAVAASIRAIAESDFTASANETSLQFRTGTSGTLASNLVVKSDGKVGVGTASPAFALDVQSASDPAEIRLKEDGNTNGLRITNFDGNEAQINNADSGPLVFKTNNTERMRFNSAGTIFIGRTSGDVSTSEHGLKILQAGQLQLSRDVNGTGTVLRAFGNLGEARIVGNGNLANTNNSYGQISDETLKQDIADAASQWADIKALKVRKFRFKDNPTGTLQIGVVAQELEASGMNGLVEEMEADGDGSDMVKTVKYSVLYMKAVKALQEAMERIETLETKVAALESG